jgi:outer membrane protein assembly factor BamA
MDNRGLLLQKLSLRLFLLFFFLTFIGTSTGAYQIDSTRVRPKQEMKKNLGRKLIKVPSLIIYSPFWLTERVADFSTNEIILSRPARRFASFIKRIYRVWGFYPTGSYGANPGLSGGLVFSSKKILTEDEMFKIKGTYSTHKYQRYYFRYTPPAKFKSFRDARLMIEYQKKPFESFYGLGGGSRRQNEVAFTLEEGNIVGSFAIPVSPRTKFGFEGSYRIINIFNGEDPDLEGDLDSIKIKLDLDDSDIRSTRFWSGRISIAYDWRDNPVRPSKGGLEQIAMTYHHGVGRDHDLGYLTGQLDLQHFVNLYKERIVAVRLLVEGISRPDNTSPLPFYLKHSLGGKDNLRGFSNRRFVDNHLILMTVEYRYAIYFGADMFIFLDEGRVFNTFRDNFSLSNWRYSAGFGLRLWNREGMILKTEIAFGDEGNRFYLQLLM